MSNAANIICYLLIATEMLGINFYNIHRMCTPVHSAVRRYINFAISSMVVSFITLYVADVLSFLGTGNGAFILGGALLLFPLCMEYKENFWRILEIACTVFSYTFFIFSLSVHFARLFTESYFAAIVLVTQSILHAALAPWCAHYIKMFFIPTDKQVSEASSESANEHKMHSLSILWLLTLFVINLAFLSVKPPLALLGLACIGALAYLSFAILHSALSSRTRVEKLRQIAYIDALTDLPNRAAFFMDGQMLLADKVPFDLVFLDLDHFKTINDSFGHNAGNEYLRGFAASITLLCKGLGKAYRMSGDEFVCILHSGAREDFVVRLINYKWPALLPNQPFLGVAAGSSRSPEDGSSLDALIHKADKAMYRQKARAR